MDQDLMLALLGAVGLGLTALFTWIGKWLVKYLRETLNIKLELATDEKIERAARQAALATEQYFRNLASEWSSREEKSAQKLEFAKRQARSLAPAATAKVGDEQLETVIEAQVASLRPPALPSMPAPTVVHSILPPAP